MYLHSVCRTFKAANTLILATKFVYACPAMVEISGLYLLFIVFLSTSVDENAAQGPTVEVQAVIKGTANLPCNIRPPIKNDSAILVVWYRNEMDAIYSYDTRGKISDSGTHWKNNTVIGNRAFFRVMPDPATLIIEDAKLSDAGPYRCRVDFQKSPTKNNKVRLQVIQPPEKPLIYDLKGKVTSNAGPYEENTDVRLICRVYGGFPSPVIRWWRSELLLDAVIISNNDEYVESELIIRKVSRFDLKSTYTCQASNNNISVPQATSVTLDLYLSPLTVSILSSRQPLSADRKYEVVCQAIGSRPPAKITWWKDSERLTNYSDVISTDENITTSTLLFTPAVKDLNKTLICRAMNPKIKTAIDEDTWILDVTFLPVPVLEYGPQLLNPNDIEEGDDVFFQCKVYANPRAYKIVWKHNGFVVQHDPKSGVHVNSATLELRSVNKQHTGNYTCFASNVEGDNESNPLELRVMYKPICKINQKRTYGFAQNENARISCEVDAYPFADAFSWSFNNSEETNDGEKHRKSERKRNVSILHITPVLETDYGYLMCSAKNVVGEQKEPCVFRIIPAGKPHPPQNCTVVNQTTNSLRVECVPGFDGGQSPLFVLDAINEDSGVLVANATGPTPSFSINNLSPGLTLTMNLYAQNGRGRSAPLIVEGSTLNTAEKHTAMPSVISLAPYMMLLLGMTAFCSISAIVIMGVLRAHSFFGNNSRFFGRDRHPSSIKQDLSNLEQTIKLNVAEDDDKNPDVVPCTKENGYEALHLNAETECTSPEHYYDNKSPALIANKEVWHLTNSVARNGDVRANNKLVLRNKIPASLTADSNRADSSTLNNQRIEPDDQTRLDRGKIKNTVVPPKNLEDASSCNIIRVPSQKEIVTVRTTLISNQQESCV